jgi:hypothetical protein
MLVEVHGLGIRAESKKKEREPEETGEEIIPNADPWKLILEKDEVRKGVTSSTRALRKPCITLLFDKLTSLKSEM